MLQTFFKKIQDGQLGHKNKSDVRSPKHVEFDQKLINLSLGNGHSGIISDKGELFMFGRGREGQLGREDSVESNAGYRTTPKLVETFKGKKVVSVQCGGEHTLALVIE